MKITKIILLLLGLLDIARAQTTPSFNSLVNNLKQYDKTYPSEKVHLHFDKPYYALGDTVWFEAYIVNAANNVPSDRSAILHVELINSKDSICKALQLPISIGYAPGDFTLTDSLLISGHYRIRAYTNWMRNFDSDYFFTKDITVVNPFPQKDKTGTTANMQPVNAKSAALSQRGYDIQFFPESGELVNGIISTVAFKAAASSGYGASITGKLMDEQNKPMLDFKTDHAGIGSFNFTPVKGKTYTTVVQLPNGDIKNIGLPKAAESGYVITTDITNVDSLTITLQTSPDKVGKEEMVFMPLSNGNPLFFYKTNFPNQRVNITAPRSKLPGGMLQFTLFNSKNEPVAERLVFNNSPRANLTLTGIKPSYQKRGKTEVNLQVTDETGNPLIGSFSMAVVNVDDISEDEQAAITIFSNLLLTSDLKGYIENPNYYFTNPSPQKIKQLDNLLLTQGYRRFVWKDIANANYPNITYLPESAITVSGTVTRNNKLAASGVHVNLLPEQIKGGGRFLDTVTNSQGYFLFKLPDNVIDTRYIVQAKEKGLQLFHINLDSYKAPNITPLLTEYADTTAVANYIKATAQSLTASGKSIDFNKVRYLKEVEVKDYQPKNKLTNSHSDNLNGPGKADYVLTAKDIERCADITCLTSMLPIKANALSNGDHLLILLDGVAINPPKLPHNDDPLSGLTGYVSPNEVESIEFMKGNSAYSAIYGLRGSGGVLLITTKRGSDRKVDTTTTKNRRYFTLPIDIARQFYSPQYNVPTSLNKEVDLRTIVYWNPEIITDKDGKAQIQFYNNDVSGNYEIIIEGVTAKGVLGRHIMKYKVE